MFYSFYLFTTLQHQYVLLFQTGSLFTPLQLHVVNIELDAGNSREFLWQTRELSLHQLNIVYHYGALKHNHAPKYQWPSMKSALKHLAVSQLLPLAGVKLFIKYTRSRDFTTHKSKHHNFSPRRSSGAAPPWVLNSYSTTRMLNRPVMRCWILFNTPTVPDALRLVKSHCTNYCHHQPIPY